MYCALLLCHNRRKQNQVNAERFRKKRKKAKVQKVINVWVTSGVAVAPFLCFSSHAGYILMAWVTDPVRTTTTFFIALGCCLYLFFMFRQCYTVYAEDSDEGDTVAAEDNVGNGHTTDEKYNDITMNKGTELEECSNVLENSISSTYGSISPAIVNRNEESADVADTGTVKKCLLFFIIPIISPFLWAVVVLSVISAQFGITTWLMICQGLVKPYQTYKQRTIPEDFLEIMKPGKTQTELSYKGMMIAFGMSWLIVAPLVLILLSFALIPVSTFLLAQYLENMSQILIVVLGLLISYKIFARRESDIEIFMRTFQDKAIKNKGNSKRQIQKVSNQRALQGMPRDQEDPQQIAPQAGEPTSQLESSKEKYDDVLEAGGAIAGELAGKLISYFDRQSPRED